MRQVAETWASENGFKRLGKTGVFMRSSGYIDEVFIGNSDWKSGAGFLTPVVGVGFPELEALTGASLESAGASYFPSFGGPIFRFKSMPTDRLHDHVVEFSNDVEVADSVAKFRSLCSRCVLPFYDRYSRRSEWISVARSFVDDNRLGPMRPTHAGRMTVAVLYAADGADAVYRALSVWETPNATRRPPQDAADAREMARRLESDEALARPLRTILADLSGSDLRQRL